MARRFKARSKYRNNKFTNEHGTWDSNKEWKRWQELTILRNAGEIYSLTRDKKDCTFKFVINGKHVCSYVADAVYMENGEKVVEDTKSPVTRNLPVYRIKNKLMQACFNINIREV